MKVINLVAENFKILRAIEITPKGDVIKIGGKNGQGKSSVLDAIWVALVGRSVAPPQPIRKGEEKCHIVLDLGDIVVTRTFTAKDGGTYTDTVKIESADGKQRFQRPQEMLNDLLGQIGFDPFAFVQLKPEDQAATLLEMVPLPIDLDDLARQDTADYANRRDINRDAESLKAQIAVIPAREVPKDAPNRAALMQKLAEAGDHNTAIEREKMARASARQAIETSKRTAEGDRQRAAEIREEIQRLEQAAKAKDTDAKEMDEQAAKSQAGLDALPALDEPIDTAAVQQRLVEAEAVLAEIDRQARRAELIKQHADKVKESEELTAAMNARELGRRKALSGARMPIEGLSFEVNDKGKAVVMFGGVPFEQASTADQIRASTAIAMSANPELRVLRIKDGSLLDEDSMAIIESMARDQDFQLWVEVVGSGGVGIVIEDGSIKGDAPPEKASEESKPERRGRPADNKPTGSLL